jgi:aminopeptidase YwaD
MVTDFAERARRALALTGRMVNELGPRPSGSEKSRLAADALGRQASTFADNVASEDFSVHPKAFLGWIRILVCIYVFAVAMLWLGVHWIAALLTTLGLIILIGQFFLYREVIDWMFPEETGRNVIASVEPEKAPRGQLIISGHHDSAYVFNFLVDRPYLYPIRVMGGIISFVVLLVVCWVLTVWALLAGASPGWSTYAAALFSLLFLLVGQLWWFASSEATPGAGDNLASSAAAWEALSVVAEQKALGLGLQYLRVVAASWDAEEAGLRGARHWAKKRDDGRLNLATWNLNLECLYDAGELFLLTSDVNGSVQLSQDLASRCQKLLADQGVEAPAKPIALLTGGTDAGEIARAGAEATSLIGMPWGNTSRSTVYHTPSDLPEAVDPEAVARAIRLALDLARDLDEALIRAVP